MPDASAPLADRGKRLAGAVVDGSLYLGAIVPGTVLAFTGLGVGADELDARLPFAMFGPVAVLYAFQMYLVTTTGQTLAKRWLSMRIVRVTGEPLGFLHGVVLRSWVLGLVSFIPWLGGMVGLADAVCIFSERNQCLHDMIAGTEVIEVA